MTKKTAPSIKDSADDYTKVTFSPDLAKFKMEKLDNDIVDLLSRRAYDIAASTRGVKVFLNDKRVPVSYKNTNRLNRINYSVLPGLVIF